MLPLNVMQKKYNDDLQNQNPPKPRLFTTEKYLLDIFWMATPFS